MELKDFIVKLKEANKQNEVISIFVRCQVHYSGRAEAFLSEGDRLIIIKQDKNILVHQPTGTTPINYMKQGSSIEVKHHGSKVHLHCKNTDLKEFLDIEILKVYSLASHQLEDIQKIELVGSERDMSDMIMANPHLIDKDFKPLSREEHTEYGFIDVFGCDKQNNLVVIECKRYVGDFHAVTQLQRYVEKMKSLRGISTVRGILACPKISPNALTMLQELGFEWRNVTPPKFQERFNANQKNLGDF